MVDSCWSVHTAFSYILLRACFCPNLRRASPSQHISVLLLWKSFCPFASLEFADHILFATLPASQPFSSIDITFLIVSAREISEIIIDNVGFLLNVSISLAADGSALALGCKKQLWLRGTSSKSTWTTVLRVPSLQTAP